jgi:hypothetical protein
MPNSMPNRCRGNKYAMLKKRKEAEEYVEQSEYLTPSINFP